MELNSEEAEALIEYVKACRAGGWKAGDRIIKKYKRKYKDFDKWARVVAIMLRAEELLKKKPR